VSFEKPRKAPLLSEKRDQRTGKETGTIAAHPPSLALKPALLPRLAQSFGGKIGGDILGRLKPGEMPAHDLARGVALQARGTFIPTQNVSFGIEHEYPVVPHSFDQS